MKHFLTFGLLIASIFSWVLLIGTDVTNTKDLSTALENAKKYESEELYIKAIESYQNAVSLTEDNYEYKIAIVNNYEKLGDEESVISLSKTLVSSYPDKIENYIRLLDYYKKDEDAMVSYVPMVMKASELFPEDKQIMAHRDELEKSYDVDAVGYKDVSLFLNGKALVAVESKELAEGEMSYVVIDEIGTESGEAFEYKDAKLTDVEGQYVIKEGEEWKVINSKGYAVAKCKDTSIEEIGPLLQGCAYAKKGDKYYLVNSELNLSKMTWDYVGSFSEGVAPVKIGTKWGIMSINNIASDSSMCKYDEVAVDEWGRCCVGERFFAKEQEKYYLYDIEGEKVTDTAYEDAKAFVSSQPAAVKQGGKWGFVSLEGKMIIQPQFEEATSFCNGYAAIRQGDKWGIINSSGKVVAEPQFDEIKYATQKGMIPVLNELGTWNFVRMNKLYFMK